MVKYGHVTGMFDSTFFKFLAVFILIIGLSLLVMHFAGGANVRP